MPLFINPFNRSLVNSHFARHLWTIGESRLAIFIPIRVRRRERKLLSLARFSEINSFFANALFRIASFTRFGYPPFDRSFVSSFGISSRARTYSDINNFKRVASPFTYAHAERTRGCTGAGWPWTKISQPRRESCASSAWYVRLVGKEHTIVDVWISNFR